MPAPFCIAGLGKQRKSRQKSPVTFFRAWPFSLVCAVRQCHNSRRNISLAQARETTYGLCDCICMKWCYEDNEEDLT